MRKAVLLLAFVACSVAKADIIPTLEAVTPEGPNNFRWTYTIELTANSRLEGDNQFFVIYDFNGYIADSIFAPAGWTGSTQNAGPIADRTNPDDDVNVTNLVFTWDNLATVTGPQTFGPFGANSRFDQQKLAFFTGNTTKNTTGNDNGTPLGNVGQVQTPTGNEDVIPEPSTMVLLGSALLGLGIMRGRRK